jgi:hypothetical protein
MPKMPAHITPMPASAAGVSTSRSATTLTRVTRSGAVPRISG